MCAVVVEKMRNVDNKRKIKKKHKRKKETRGSIKNTRKYKFSCFYKKYEFFLLQLGWTYAK